MKNILNIISITLICFIVSACSGVQESPEKLSIQTVYSMDSKILKTSDSAAQVVAKMESIRLVGCPHDFVEDYGDCVNQWKRLAILEKKMYASDMTKANSDIESFIGSYAKNSADSVLKLKEAWPSFTTEIDSINMGLSKAYAQLKATGLKYKAE